MKKSLLNWMTIMLMAFVYVGFAACGGDDDNSNPNSGGGGEGGGIQNILVGTWYRSWDKESSSSGTSGWESYSFRADGTGVYSGSNQNYDRYGNKSGLPNTWNENFRYTILEYDSYLKAGKMDFKATSDSKFITYDFGLDGKVFTFWTGVYTKK